MERGRGGYIGGITLAIVAAGFRWVRPGVGGLVGDRVGELSGVVEVDLSSQTQRLE